MAVVTSTSSHIWNTGLIKVRMNARGISNNTKPKINDQGHHLVKGREDVEKKQMGSGKLKSVEINDWMIMKQAFTSKCGRADHPFVF